MTIRHRRCRVAVAAVVAFVGAGSTAACGTDGGADLGVFCERIEALRDDDPFADLAVASPGEMRDAFADLRDAAEGIATAAPGEARVQADRYRRSVEVLVDELAAAGYDPRRLDPTRYRGATDDYTAAAISLDNAADATCADR